MKHRRVAGACVVSLVAIVGANCGSSGPTSSSGTTSSAPQASTTTTTSTTTNVSTSVAQGSPPFGSAQTVTSPSGQKVTGTAGKPGPIGYSVGGPPGSWAMGFSVGNPGPGTFAWNPSAQVTMVDSSGKNNTPRVATTATTTTGKPTTIAVGQKLAVLLIFVLTPGAHPKSVTFAPFGTSVALTQWSA